jgi:hypothetical protein
LQTFLLRSETAKWLFAVIGVGALCVTVFFYPLLTSKFRLLLGDLGDTRFVNAILEHWLTFSIAGWAWDSPPIFYPLSGALAYSDVLFLYVPFYAVARAANLSPYYALAFTAAMLLVVGYAGAIWLLRRTFALPPWISILGGAIYAFAGMRASHYVHIQLYAALFLPFLLGALIRYLDRLQDGKLGIGAGLTVALGLAAVFLTSFYVGWFFLFYLGLAGVCLIFLRPFEGDALPLRVLTARRPLISLFVVAAAFIVALVPFLWLYLPGFREMGPRPWAFVLGLLPSLPDLGNVGPGNLMWGGFVERFVPPGRDFGHEQSYGVPLGLLSLFLGTVGFLFFFRNEEWFGSPNRQWNASCLRALALAVLISWALLLAWGDHSLWRGVFRLVPGASAIRAPFRFQVVLFLTIVVVAMFGLAGLWRATKGKAFRRLLLGAFSVFLLVEQVETRSPVFEAKAETAWLKRIQRPPAFCRQFLLLADPERSRSWYAANIDAMLIAILWRIPTINGYSGNFPPGWSLQDPAGSSYLNAATEWVQQHALKGGLCTLQPATGVWRRVLPGPSKNLLDLDLAGRGARDLEEGLSFSRSGFHSLEPEGRWTNGLGIIAFAAPLEARRLRIEGSQWNPFGGEVRVLINGRIVFRGVLPNAPFVIEVPLGEAVGEVQIDSATFVPKKLGVNEDSRQLGVFIHSLKLD